MKKLLFLFIFFTLFTQAQLKLGDSLPSFTLNNTKNLKVTSSQFKDKFVLIDFWASWCAPCRIANKELVKLYNSFDSTSIEIIGISLDTDKEKWLKAINKDKIKYMQLIDNNGFDSKTARLFGVESLPAKFLFDQKGILIAVNPTNQEIRNFLKKTNK